MTRPFTTRCARLLCACAAVAATAAGAAEPLTLAGVMAAAAENYDVALARAGARAARADIAAADHAPLPQLIAKASMIDLQNGIGSGNVLTDKRIDKSIGVDWTWERGGKRALRTRAAEQAADAAQADVDEARLAQQVAALGAYVDLLAQQQRTAELDALARDAEQFARALQRRFDAGDVGQQEAARAAIEARRARLETEQAALERRRAALALGTLLGPALPAAAPAQLTVQPAWPPALAPTADGSGRDGAPGGDGTGSTGSTGSIGSSGSSGSTAELADVAAWVERRTDVRAADARVRAAEAARDGALALRRSDVTVGASLDHYPGTSTRLLELRVQLPLQWGYAQQGEIGRAEALLGQARDTAARTRLFAAQELRQLFDDAGAQAGRVRAYDDDIVPRARRLLAQAELAFDKRAIALTDVIDARRTLRGTLLDALTARADHARADGTWRLRTGLPLAPP